MVARHFASQPAVAFAGCVAFLAPFELSFSTASAAEPTKVEDLVMYGVPQESQELFRYDFGSDTFSAIGVVTDLYGRTVVDLKSLTYVPSGPDKGLYGASEESPFEGYLIKIDPLTADATVYDGQPMGWSNRVSGMTAIQDPLTGKWLLLATEKDKDLFTVDPATGVGTYLCTLKEWYNGLAMDATGLVFGAKGNGELWAIDVARVMSGDVDGEWKVGQHGNGGIEALEFAFGIDEPRVRVSPAKLPGIGNPWVENGMLFTYGQGSGLLIVNPNTGAAIPYPCSMPSLDLEGIAFLPENADGWGQITVNACD
jgi:hypothetical protein